MQSSIFVFIHVYMDKREAGNIVKIDGFGSYLEYELSIEVNGKFPCCL